MIGVGRRVMILSSYSLWFGGKWGIVKEINQEDPLPLGVAFTEESSLYYFDYCEVMSEETVFEWICQSYSARLRDTGRKVDIGNNHNFPFISTSIGLINFSILDPFTICRQCGEETTGSYSDICDDCNYPLPSKI